MKNIQAALDAWGKYARLTFHRTSDANGDIVVAFASGYHGDRLVIKIENLEKHTILFYLIQFSV